MNNTNPTLQDMTTWLAAQKGIADNTSALYSFISSILSGTIQLNDGRVTDLTTQVTTLTAQVTDLTTKLDTANATITTLQNSLNTNPANPTPTQ